ncbi:MAG: tRNA pseudouridine(38-40) synthase TruA [Bacilli bacterium]
MRYLINFSYDGSNFDGYQKQPNCKSIQQNIEHNLSIILQENIKIHASGRTDKGVHAINAYAHFDILEEIVNINKVKKSLNSMVDDAIYIKSIVNVDYNFHARYNVIKKVYEYKINTGCYNPFQRNYIYQYNKKLNLKKMEECFTYLIGIHDFKSFVSSDKDIKNFTKNIYKIDVNILNDIITITFEGNGFLKHQIRNMMGTVLTIIQKDLNSNIMEEILKSKDRRNAFIKISSVGLYLKDVYYK